MAFALTRQIDQPRMDALQPWDGWGSGGTPNGVLTAPKGSRVWDDTTAQWYINTNGSTAWSAMLDGGSSASTAAAGTGNTSSETPAFSGTAALTGEVNHATGTGFATVGQVVTTSDNQTLGVDECAGMWLITATQAPCLIVSHPACAAAPLVATVFGLAPTTAAEAYRILRAPTPAGTVGAHTHTGPSHTHTVTITP
jgi:hypothetical protein